MVVACPKCGKNTGYDRCAACGADTSSLSSELLPFSQRKTFTLSGESVWPAFDLWAQVSVTKPQPKIRSRETRRIDHGPIQRRRPQRRDEPHP